MGKGFGLQLWKVPDYKENLPEAMAESTFATMTLSGVKAELAGMVVLRVLLIGLVFLALRIPIIEDTFKATNIVRLWDIIGAPWENVEAALEWVGILLALWFLSGFFGVLSEHFIRFVVSLLGLSISVREGMPFRRYVIKPGARIFFIVLAIPFVAAAATLFFYGFRGWLHFLMPRFALKLTWPITASIVAAILGAFLFFPAIVLKTHSREEMMELVIETSQVAGFKARDKLLKDMVRIAAPHLSNALVADIEQNGPGAMDNWMVIPRQTWEKRIDALKSARSLRGLDTNAITRVQQHKDGPRNLISLTDNEGTVHVYDFDVLKQEMAAQGRNEGG